jgi:MOSC domain-containing protein YiiM
LKYSRLVHPGNLQSPFDLIHWINLEVWSVKVISVNVGKPKIIEYMGELVTTGIFKSPIDSKVRVNELNLDGDGQADLRVHGGVQMAVYVYPSEHYEYWRDELPYVELPWGAFGENLTTEGLLENQVKPGDSLRIGTAEFAITKPRYPCFKLGIRLGRKDVIRRFAQSGRSGFYLSVQRTGELQPGDAIDYVPGAGDKTIAEIVADRLKHK